MIREMQRLRVQPVVAHRDEMAARSGRRRLPRRLRGAARGEQRHEKQEAEAHRLVWVIS